MTTLSPPLFLAGLHQFVDAHEIDPAGDLLLYWSGAHRPDIEFVHRVGRASHRDAICGVTSWPLSVCDTPDALVAFAASYGLRTVLAVPGDLVVIGREDELHGGSVGVVVRVEEYASDRRVGPSRCQLMLAEPCEEVPQRMRLATLRRWCGPSRGDVVIRWVDLNGRDECGRAA